jgi:hypothetical protein
MITHAPASLLPTPSRRDIAAPVQPKTRRLTGALLLALLPYLEAVLLLIACGYGF